MGFDINSLPKTQTKTYEFEGIPNGDNESFCWDVDRETYIKIKGKELGKFDKSYFNEGLYRLYFEDLLGFDNPKCKFKISYEIIE